MKKILIVFILFLKVNSIYAQSVFQKAYGDTNTWEIGKVLQITNDGGYIITGQAVFGSGLNPSAYLLKTDSTGNFEWMKEYEGAYGSQFVSLQQTADEGYIVTGYTKILPGNGGYTTRVFLLKTDVNGDTLWTKMYGDSTSNYYGIFVLQTNDLGYIIFAGDDDGSFTDAHLIRTDSLGNIVWTNVYGSDELNSVWETADGGFVITGSSYLGITIVKTDSSGLFLWKKRLVNPNEHTYSYASSQTHDSGFILAGIHEVNSFSYNCYLTRTDSSGLLVWNKSYIVSSNTQFNSIHETQDGGFIGAGYIKYSNNFGKMFALRTDSTGSVIWMRTYGSGTGNEDAYNIQEIPGGGFVITGSCDSLGAGLKDIYLVKTDSFGISGCNDSLLYPTVFVPAISSSNQNSFASDPMDTGSPLTAVNTIIPQQTIICSSVVGIEDKSFSYEKIFPNPFTSAISITFQEQNIKQITFTIHNIFGQTVFHKQESNLYKTYSKTIDLGSLSNGIYLLDVTIDGERIVKKIVKE